MEVILTLILMLVTFSVISFFLGWQVSFSRSQKDLERSQAQTERGLSQVDELLTVNETNQETIAKLNGVITRMQNTSEDYKRLYEIARKQCDEALAAAGSLKETCDKWQKMYKGA